MYLEDMQRQGNRGLDEQVVNGEGENGDAEDANDVPEAEEEAPAAAPAPAVPPANARGRLDFMSPIRMMMGGGVVDAPAPAATPGAPAPAPTPDAPATPARIAAATPGDGANAANLALALNNSNLHPDVLASDLGAMNVGLSEGEEEEESSDEEGAQKTHARFMMGKEDKNYDPMTSISNEIERAMSVRTYFRRDRSQKLPIVVWAWNDGESTTTYITVRVELLGTMRAKDIKPEIVRNGRLVRVSISFPRGGELTNPEHLLLLNQDFDEFNENHSQYANLAMAHRHANDALLDGEELHSDSFELLVDLPIECETEFINPFGADDDDGMLIGSFPLDKRHYKNDANGPVPSVKLMHLSLEEKQKKRTVQKPKERSYFS
jgi:hypothetical protein